MLTDLKHKTLEKRHYYEIEAHYDFVNMYQTFDHARFWCMSLKKLVFTDLARSFFIQTEHFIIGVFGKQF